MFFFLLSGSYLTYFGGAGEWLTALRNLSGSALGMRWWYEALAILIAVLVYPAELPRG